MEWDKRMSSEEVGKGKGGKSRTGFTQTMRKLPASKNSKTIIILVLVLGISVFGIPLLVNVISGSFGGLTIDETNIDQYIGYAKFTYYTPDMNGTYQQTNGTLLFYNYYTNEQIGNGSADGTVYQFTNVTVGFVNYVESNDGYSYPNKSFLIYANKTVATAFNNKVYLNPIGKASEFECTFYKIAKEDGTVPSYGNLGIADITTFAETNFSMTLQLDNNGNGTFGENFYIPLEFRFNETISDAGLWIRFNVVLDFVGMNRNQQKIYYDGSGNSYFYLPTLAPQSQLDVELQLECQTLPTNIQIIQGQWNGTILKTFS